MVTVIDAGDDGCAVVAASDQRIAGLVMQEIIKLLWRSVL